MIEMDMPRIEVEEKDENGYPRSYAKVVVEPLEKGFGLTIGNCLRRILLSALPGAAVQGIRFYPDGLVKHEFSAIPGVKEDVTEIILNLKTLAIQTASTDKDYIKTLHLCKEGPCDITGADLMQDAEVEVINKDRYICHIDEGAKIDCEITIGRGRGYKGAGSNKNHPIGYIPIDSIYTPVKKVNYNVESTRVGQNIDYDKLVMEVWTNAERLHQGHGHSRQERGRQAAAGARNGDRGHGPVRPFLQLPQARKHPHRRRFDQKDRGRNAQSSQPRQKVVGRGHPQIGVLRPLITKKGGLTHYAG